MDAKDLIAAHQIHGEWYGDDPKNDLNVAYSMLLLSVVPAVSANEILERQARLDEIIKRQTEHLRRMEDRFLVSGIDKQLMLEWAELLTQRAYCIALEGVLDALAKR